MRDEFRGNFSRDAFDKDKQFSRILMQQGRVLLDSDLNGLQDLMVYYLRTLAEDVIGPHGGLEDDNRNIHSFKIDAAKDGKDITIAPGHYYVDGILCINDKLDSKGDPIPINYKDQDGYVSEETMNSFSDGIPPLKEGKNLIYLDVWERSISYIQDDTLLETALGMGDADTAVRSRVVWQVKAWADSGVGCESTPWEKWTGHRGLLKAKIIQPEGNGTEDCVVSQGVQLIVPKNLLFRIEIHRPGTAGGTSPATFKWSCINGSADFKVSGIVRGVETAGKKKDIKLDVATVTLYSPLESGHLSLEVGDIVELVDDTYILARQAFPLWRVHSIDTESNQVILKRKQPDYTEFVGMDAAKNPLLRRWDQKPGNASAGGLELSDDNAAMIKEWDGIGDDKDYWLNLGMGVAIQFQKSNDADPFNYRTGDYWLIPVRALTELKWPKALPPHGIRHHYAPLAVISLDDTGKIIIDKHCRFIFKPAAKKVTPSP